MAVVEPARARRPAGQRGLHVEPELRAAALAQEAHQVLEITSKKEMYWKAATLDTFLIDHWQFSAQGRLVGSSDGGSLAEPIGELPPKARLAPHLDNVNVKVLGLADDHLVGAGQPVKWTLPHGIQSLLDANGTVTTLADVPRHTAVLGVRLRPQPDVAPAHERRHEVSAGDQGRHRRRQRDDSAVPEARSRRGYIRSARRSCRPRTRPGAPRVPNRPRTSTRRRSSSSTTSAPILPVHADATPDGEGAGAGRVHAEHPSRLLPDVLRRDGARPAPAWHPRARGGRLHAGQAAGLGHLRGERSQRPRLGRGVLPRAMAGIPFEPTPAATCRRTRRPRTRSSQRSPPVAARTSLRRPGRSWAASSAPKATSTRRYSRSEQADSEGLGGRAPSSQIAIRTTGGSSGHGRFITWLFTSRSSCSPRCSG